MLSPEQTRAYLDRIGIAEAPAPTPDALDRLVWQHQMHVPFETIELHRTGVAPALDTESLFDKVVAQRKGGYCFELNKLFTDLLESLGFDARPALSRAVRGRDGRMPINHRSIIVSIGGQGYAVDVGFGGPMPAGALRLADCGDQVVRGEAYATVPDASGWWRIERVTQAEADLYDDERPVRRQVELELCPATVEDIDFDALNMHCSRPGTLFRDHETVNLRTEDGYRGFKDGVLTIREGGRKTVVELGGREAQDAALLEHFGLAY